MFQTDNIMADSDGNPKERQLITESYARFLQVILESRLRILDSTSGHGSASSSAQGRPFNIVLGKLGPMTDKVEPWSRGAREPMIIDIMYLQHGVKGGQKLVQNVRNMPAQGSLKVALEAPASETAILLERWTVEFVQCNGASSRKVEREIDLFMEKGIFGRYWRVAQNSKHKVLPLRINGRGKDELEAIHNYVEKNLSILVRSLYSTARLLPTYNLSRLLKTTGKFKSRLAYRVLTTSPPLPENIKKDMTLFCFPPADCHHGHLTISVAYRRIVPMEEQTTSCIPSHIIMDYVGKHQLKHLPGEKIMHVHSLPSAHRHPSLKPSNLQRHQPATQEKAPKSNEEATFDCPFAIDQEIQDRKEEAKWLSVKSDVGLPGKDLRKDTTAGSVLAMLRPPEPLRLARENLFLSLEPKKTVVDALKELQMYIDFKDNLLK